MSDYWEEIEKMEEERDAQEYAEAQAYKQGRADGYSKAETDYYKQSEKDRQSAYDCGYEKGRADKYQEIASKYMLLTEKQVAEIRVDAIEEFRTACESASYIPIGYGYYVTDMKSIRKIAELLKEKNNG